MSFIITLMKDSLLCLLMCSTLANINKNKKTAVLSLVIIFILFMMGYDL